LSLYKYISLVKQNGLSYVINRIGYQFEKNTGLYKIKHDVKPVKQFPLTKSEWKQQTPKFFFQSKYTLSVSKTHNTLLQQKAENILNGNYPYFNHTHYKVDTTNKWNTHPITKQILSSNKHYLIYNDFEPGFDIKYIWELSRFCYLYDIIRYDYHYENNQDSFVINEICNWIAENPLSFGPQYISGQEIALRVLNWLFVLYYYSDSPALTEERWQTIMCSIYGQLKLIDTNLHFARKFVRNNHVLTEATALFIYSTLFPQITESKKWLQQTKQILEDEIHYQFFEDGTYLQYSTNYHRVALQVYNWAYKIAELNNNPFNPAVKKRLLTSLQFLVQCTDESNGELPNYGANDGSLFFVLNDNTYRDYRAQLQCLANTLQTNCFENFKGEDTFWINGNTTQTNTITAIPGIHLYQDGGYCTIKNKDNFTFIKCGAYLRRPSQADNLHIDIWANGINIMRDAGSYQYNTAKQFTAYFFGTNSHNTISINQADQMEKGPRFIWFYWSDKISSKIAETENTYQFEGEIEAFKHIKKGIRHKRIVTQQKEKQEWEIIDIISNKGNLPIQQIWHPHPEFNNHFMISAFDEHAKPIDPIFKEGFYSNSYGQMETAVQIQFISNGNQIKTIIKAI
jgi:hypothetical protein